MQISNEYLDSFRLISLSPSWDVEIIQPSFSSRKDQWMHTLVLYDKSMNLSEWEKRKKIEHLDDREDELRKIFEEEHDDMRDYYQVHEVLGTDIIAVYHAKGNADYQYWNLEFRDRQNGNLITFREFYPTKKTRYTCEKKCPLMQSDLDSRVKALLSEKNIREREAIFKIVLSGEGFCDLVDTEVNFIMHLERDVDYDFSNLRYMNNQGVPLESVRVNVEYVSELGSRWMI